jgi:hypothetical protein
MLTCYEQFWTNSIIVLMFVESQTVHIESICKECNKNWSVVLLNKKNKYTSISSLCRWGHTAAGQHGRSAQALEEETLRPSLSDSVKQWQC